MVSVQKEKVKNMNCCTTKKVIIICIVYCIRLYCTVALKVKDTGRLLVMFMCDV